MKAERRSAYKPSWKEKLINTYPFPRSKSYLWLLRSFGMNVGRNVKIFGRLKVKIRGKFENITIEDDVVLGKNVDLRNRENGKILIRHGVYIDDNVRLLAAREGSIEVDTGTEIAAHTIINSGGVTKIGKFVMCAGYVNINSSSHGMKKERYVQDQHHEHGYVTIGDDVWIGAYAAILMNTSVGEGAVLGSHSVVRGEVPDFGICVGVPGKVIKYRE